MKKIWYFLRRRRIKTMVQGKFLAMDADTGFLVMNSETGKLVIMEKEI